MQNQSLGSAAASFSLLLVSLSGCGADDSEANGTLIRVQEALHATNLLATVSPTVCFVKAAGAMNFETDLVEVQTAMTQWEAASGLDFQFQGECGPAVGGVYPGDIRILLNELQDPEVVDIPGCSQDLEGSNSGAFPGTISTSCKYNASYWTGQPINNYLHESGHSIGFLHEHIRSTTPVNCQVPGHSLADGRVLTPYDVDSVMHYTVCTAPGNGGETGLSVLDELGAEISYPHSTQIPIATSFAMPYGGGWAFRTDQGGFMTPAWYVRGALPSVFTSFTWTIGSSAASNLSQPISGDLGAGPITATMQFTDPWNRPRTGSTQIWTSNSKYMTIVMAAMGT